MMGVLIIIIMKIITRMYIITHEKGELTALYINMYTEKQSYNCAIHTKRGQTQTSLHKSWLWGIEKLPHPALPGDQTQGLQIWIPMLCHWAMYPVS